MDSKTVFQSIKDAVSKALTDNSVTNAVVKAFVDKENDRRVKLLIQALDKLPELNKTLAQVNRPDNKMFQFLPDGTKITVESMTEKRFQEIEKAKKNVAELDACITKAITEAKFDELEKQLKKGPQDAKPATEEE